MGLGLDDEGFDHSIYPLLMSADRVTAHYEPRFRDNERRVNENRPMQGGPAAEDAL